jgi:hypothetical protein
LERNHVAGATRRRQRILCKRAVLSIIIRNMIKTIRKQQRKHKKNIVQKQEQKNIKKSKKNTCIFLRGRVYSQLL